MSKASFSLSLCSLALLTIAGGAVWQLQPRTAEKMGEAARTWIGQLDDAQKAKALVAYEEPKRLDWHFIPKDSRKGLQLKEMTAEQKKSADKLLAACLSEAGYKKVTTIMDLEIFLKTVQDKKNQATPLRDPQRYYFTIFGSPEGDKKWGLSIEGHHFSLNFAAQGDKLVSATPLALCSNPAEVMTSLPEAPKTPKGTRLLASEEVLAFELVNALSAEQKKKAVIDEKAPAELREAAQPQPKVEAPAGIAYSALDAMQQKQLTALVDVYLNNLPEDVAASRREGIKAAGWDGVHFAWVGAQKPGVGHYYRIQGKTFLIEFVNVQPDAEGNLANHIHCVLRNMSGDFGIDLEK